jgi:RNA polymerase sigma-70 factor (ECF subfamily)
LSKEQEKQKLNLAEEQALVLGAQEGDTRAFAELVEAHQLFAYNVALRAVNNSQDAEDIVQEAFINAWKSISNFRMQSRFKTWLYRIVMNLCYNRLPELRKEAAALDEDVLNLKDSRIPGPADYLEGKEITRFIQRQVRTLPGQYQVMLLLRVQQGCSYAEIAEIMDLPLGTVKTGIFRARKRLRELICEYQEEWVRL